MEKVLLIQAHLLDDRYHGKGDWPPAPARLFQALVAGNAIGAQLPADCVDALRWLESLDPPEIHSQRGRLGLPYTTFVPNNDLDAKGGDPARIADIRVGKTIQPRHIDCRRPITYLWQFHATEAGEAAAAKICAMVENIYQLGRGVDMAWARAAVLDSSAVSERVESAACDTYRPGRGFGEVRLDCPQPGSLTSLLRRFEAHRGRLNSVIERRKPKVLFSNPPKAAFRPVDYNPGARWRLFELRALDASSPFYSWPQERAVALTEQVRDKVAMRLATALPGQAEVIERVIIGRGANNADKDRRVQMIPIPSIGHEQTNRAIRRILVRVPADCPLSFDDIDWAASGLTIDKRDSESAVLIAADDLGMLRHYALESGETYRTWRSITPLVLPGAGRRRIDPKRTSEEAKPGEERAEEERRACGAVFHAMRHAGLRARVEAIRVQREPFSRRGVRAEAFAAGSRFPKERLWHVELRFAEPVEGLIVLGDGRYLGLGLMAPDKETTTGVWGYDIVEGLQGDAKPEALTRSLRRAVMARVQMLRGPRRPLPGFFTGHEPDGRVLRRGNHQHLAFAADSVRNRLLVIAPHVLESREPTKREREYLAQLDSALSDFSLLRAGRAGLLHLEPVTLADQDSALFGHARRWETITPYSPTRQAKDLSPAEALQQNVLAEVRRLGLPVPSVQVASASVGPRGGLTGQLRLEFPRVVSGPILIGRTRHFGGGLFKVCD